MKNEYVDIKIIEDNVYIKIKGLDYVFIDNYDRLYTDLKSMLLDEPEEILGNLINIKEISFDNNNVSLSIYSHLKDNSFYTSLYIAKTFYDLKTEVGYEIINKLKELYGDKLYE